MSTGELCPMCGRDDAGCVVREEGSFCHGPPKAPPPSSPKPAPRGRRVTLADIVEEYDRALKDPEVRRFAVGLAVQSWGHSLRRFLGLSARL